MSQSSIDTLPPRQQQVVELSAKGLTYGQIADRLGLSWHTVHRHIARAVSKVGPRKTWRRLLAHASSRPLGNLPPDELGMLDLLVKAALRSTPADHLAARPSFKRLAMRILVESDLRKAPTRSK